MPDPKDFQPRVALVTGGSSGIGQACCAALARDLSLDVGFTYHSDEDGAKRTAEMVEGHGRRAVYRRADFSKLPESADVVDDLAGELGGVDVFVANAGMGVSAPILELTFDQWRLNLAVDLDAVFLTCQRAARHMVKAGRGGRILVVTSVHERVPLPMAAAYTAAKHGAGGLVKSLALELGEHGITANAVAPGEIATDMNDMTGQEALDTARPALPAGRPGLAAEVAALVTFLASPSASYITGSRHRVDGGCFETAAALASTQHRGKLVPNEADYGGR